MRTLIVACLILLATPLRADPLPDPPVPRLEIYQVKLAAPLAAKRRRLKIAGAVLLTVGGLALVGSFTNYGLLLGGPRCDWDTCNNLTPAQNLRGNQELAAAGGLEIGAGLACGTGVILLSLALP